MSTILKLVLAVFIFAVTFELASLTRGGVGPILAQVVSR